MLDGSSVRCGLIYAVANGEPEAGETCPRCFLLSTPALLPCYLCSCSSWPCGALKFVEEEGVLEGP